jgi:hypothetical protein
VDQYRSRTPDGGQHRRFRPPRCILTVPALTLAPVSN